MTADNRPLHWPLIVGALLALLAVAAGAFGAHGLRAMVSERSLAVFQTGVSYQMTHSIALVLIALLAMQHLSRRLLGLAAGFFLAGILMFSGSLYVLVLTDIRWVGPITPVGGVCFLLGWGLLAAAGVQQARRRQQEQ